VLADFRSTGKAEWENDNLDRFLDGLSAFAGARLVDAAPRAMRTSPSTPVATRRLSAQPVVVDAHASAMTKASFWDVACGVQRCAVAAW